MMHLYVVFKDNLLPISCLCDRLCVMDRLYGISNIGDLNSSYGNEECFLER